MRLVQLARMLAIPLTDLAPDSARALIAASPEDLADALFHEAADSDDVTDSSTALDYLEGRIGFFGELISPDVAEKVRAAFRDRISVWDSSPR